MENKAYSFCTNYCFSYPHDVDGALLWVPRVEESDRNDSRGNGMREVSHLGVCVCVCVCVVKSSHGKKGVASSHISSTKMQREALILPWTDFIKTHDDQEVGGKKKPQS